MPQLTYLDFDLTIYPRGSGYSSRVLGSPGGGSSEQSFDPPFDQERLNLFFAKIGQPRTRRAESPELSIVKSFGDDLFRALFSGQTLSCLRASLDEATRQNKGLRIRLHLTDAPALTELPWEYLYNASLNSFLALSDGTPIIRYLDFPETVRSLQVLLPLRILVVISGPEDLPALDVQYEWESLQRSLSSLQDRSLVIVDCIRPATIEAVQDALRSAEYHIFHFVGHGIFEQGCQDGFLAFEDEHGNSRHVSGQELGVLLHDYRSLRLAVFNSCDAARTSLSDPFSGVAQGVVQQGIPAVIAMQFEITDRAAIKFATDFYRSIAEGFPLEASLAYARKSMYLELRSVEWGTPVLYLRSPEGKIFDVTRPALSASELDDLQAMIRKGKQAIDKRDFHAGVEILESALAKKPDLPEAHVLLAYARPEEQIQKQIQQLHAAALSEINALPEPQEEPMSMRLLKERAPGSSEYRSLRDLFYKKYLRKPLWARCLLFYRPAEPAAWLWHVLYYASLVFAVSALSVGIFEPKDPDSGGAIGGGLVLVALASVWNILANLNYRRNARPRKKVDTLGNFLIFGTLFCGGMSAFMVVMWFVDHRVSFYTETEAGMLFSLAGVFWPCYRTRRRQMTGKISAAPIDSAVFVLCSLLLLAIFVVTVIYGASRGAFPHYSIIVRAVAVGLAVLAARRHYRALLRLDQV